MTVSPDLIGDRTNWKRRGGEPIFAPRNPWFPEWQKNSSWDWLPAALKSEQTKVVWVGPNKKWWDLAGPRKGRQGVAATTNFTGLGPAPFAHRYSEGPYVAGAILERVDT